MFFTLRKHWKKSLFGSVLICYGFHYSSQRYREYIVRRKFFFTAKKFGEESISPLEKPRRLYVILNPTAYNGKCKKLYQKNAAPIFNLAGIDITLIQTDYEGHGKTIANYFDPTIDGVVVAGGDGTVQEVVTGILRQKLNDPIIRLPLGVIPVGQRGNSLHKKLFGCDVINVRAMCTAALNIVEGYQRKIHVMEIKTDQKSIFALDSLHIGLNQEVKEQIDARRYWLLGPLKSYFAYIWRTVKNWPGKDLISIDSSSLKVINQQSVSSDIINHASCEKEGHGNSLNETSSTSLNSMKTPSLSLYLQEDDENNPELLVQITKEEQTKKQFINYGWQWIRNNFNYTSSEFSTSLTCKELVITPSEQEQQSFGIDGEVFDAKPIHVIVHPQKLSMFAPSCQEHVTSAPMVTGVNKIP